MELAVSHTAWIVTQIYSLVKHLSFSAISSPLHFWGKYCNVSWQILHIKILHSVKSKPITTPKCCIHTNVKTLTGVISPPQRVHLVLLEHFADNSQVKFLMEDLTVSAFYFHYFYVSKGSDTSASTTVRIPSFCFWITASVSYDFIIEVTGLHRHITGCYKCHLKILTPY